MGAGPVVDRHRRRRRVPLAAGLIASLLALAMPAPPAAGQQDDEALTNPLLGDPQAIEEGERIFRSRCTGCHWSPLRAPVLFQSELSDEKFLETVIGGRQGSRGNMPPFGYVLSPDDVWKVHAFVMARDRL
jgi:mono/diheme cytochrome c family protein